MASPSIHRIERWNYLLAVILVVLAVITQPRPVVLGVAIGAGLTCANFFVLRRLVVKWTSEVARGKAGNSSLFMLPKMLVLMGAVAVTILFLPVDIMAFVAGYSIFMVSIVIETVYAALRTEPDRTDTPSESDHG